jgi:hypothetical protein
MEEETPKETKTEAFLNENFSQILGHFDGDLEAACSALRGFSTGENDALMTKVRTTVVSNPSTQHCNQ